MPFFACTRWLIMNRQMPRPPSAVQWTPMRDPFRRLRGATLLVNLRSGVTIEGTLTSTFGEARGTGERLLELHGCKVFVPGRNPEAADGPHYVPHSEVTYCQRVYPPASAQLVGLPKAATK